MTSMIAQDCSPIRFEHFALEAGRNWRPRSSFAFVERLRQVPLSDSELLQSSHHLPIAIDQANGKLEVVAITASPFQRSPVTDASGRWRRTYAPIALRCFPFRAAADGDDGLEIALDEEPEGETTLPVLDENGKPSAEIRQIAGLLRRHSEGQRRLRTAAERLLIAGVLVPLQFTRVAHASVINSHVLTVDRNKFSGLSPQRVAHIARDDFLPIDLVTACLFSQRLMPGLVSVPKDVKGETDSVRASVDIELGLASDVQLDGSDLFSFELFTKASGQT